MKKAKESDTVLLIEESILNEDITKALEQNFLTIHEPLPAAVTSTSVMQQTVLSNGAIPAGSAAQADTRRLRYKPLITPTAGLFQWIKLPPGSNHINWLYQEHLSYIYNMHVLLSNSEEFCRFSLQTNDEVTFPDLDCWVERMISKVQQRCFISNNGEPPRIVFLFYDLEKQASKTQRKISKDPQHVNKIVSEYIDWACTHVLLKFDIEIVRCKGYGEVSEYLHTMSRSLESQLERPLTAFNCVNKAVKIKAADELSGFQKEKFLLNQTWMAMLQMLPHMSKERAIAVTSLPEFSCAKRVYELMNDTNLAKKERKILMQSSFGGKRDRDGNVIAKNPKLSKQIYKLVTEHNPNKNIGDDSDDD